MSILTLLSIITSVLGGIKDIEAIIDDLRAHGHPDNEPIPPTHRIAIVKALGQIQSAQWPEQLGDKWGPE